MSEAELNDLISLYDETRMDHDAEHRRLACALLTMKIPRLVEEIRRLHTLTRKMLEALEAAVPVLSDHALISADDGDGTDAVALDRVQKAHDAQKEGEPHAQDH